MREEQEALVLEHRRLARHLAQRYVRTAEQREDLEQAAYLGLVKAARRYEPQRGIAFTTFAVPTILGEVRRFCRDTRWATHVPRPVQERVQALRRAEDEHHVRHGRSPNVSEIASELGWSEEDVLDARIAAGSLRPESLNATVAAGDGVVGEAIDCIGAEDRGFLGAEQRDELQRALARLAPSERRALRLRGEVGCSTPEIALQLGVSRSQASRLVLQATDKLRTALATDADRPSRRRPAASMDVDRQSGRRRRAKRLQLSPGDWCGPHADGGLGWLVVSGALLRTVTVDRRRHAELLGPDDVLRADAGDLQASWRVIEHTELAALDPSLCHSPAAIDALLRRLSERSHALARQLAMSDLRRADDRLLHLFEHLAERWGEPAPGGLIISMPLTHDMLAALIGTHRPTVTTAIRRLEREGRLCRLSDDRWHLTVTTAAPVAA